MTHAEVLAQYRPIRAGIRRVLREAAKACGRADLNRAVKQVAPWAEAAEIEDGETAEMLVDVALFEPNQRGRREEARARRSGRKRARRWVVERTHAWLNRCRRLLVRWERKVANHAAFLHLACALICDRAAGASAGTGARR